jgi:hypothetical protein
MKEIKTLADLESFCRQRFFSYHKNSTHFQIHRPEIVGDDWVWLYQIPWEVTGYNFKDMLLSGLCPTINLREDLKVGT